MEYTKKEFGTMPDGRTAYLYTLENENGTIAQFTDLGAIWVSMQVRDKKGTLDDVVLGYDTFENYRLNPPHIGATVGRNANRIANGTFEINGVTYPLAINNGPNNLHSGPDYYDRRLWDAEASEGTNGTQVSFSLSSPDGDQGFPGNAEITVTYTLTPDDSVMIHYHMVCDQDTLANFTNHSYFNLAGQASGDAMNQMAWINADTFTPNDEFSIPTGEIRPVAGTPMDFTTMKTIGKDINENYDQLVLGNGYDHNWVVNGWDGEVNLIAKAYDPVTGRAMDVYTDLPGVQFYTANFLTDELPGKHGAVYGKRTAYCFETNYYPDAIHKPQFPSPVLKAGEEYDTTTIYHFYTE